MNETDLLDAQPERDSFVQTLEAYYEDPSPENLEKFFAGLRGSEVILPITAVQLVVDGEEEELYEYSPLMVRGEGGETRLFVFFGREGFHRFKALNDLSSRKLPEVEAMQLPVDELLEVLVRSTWDVISFDSDGPMPLTFSRSAFERCLAGEQPVCLQGVEERAPMVDGSFVERSPRRKRSMSGIFKRLLGG